MGENDNTSTNKLFVPSFAAWTTVLLSVLVFHFSSFLVWFPCFIVVVLLWDLGVHPELFFHTLAFF